jgi:uncharacterized protein (DUF4415 family)
MPAQSEKQAKLFRLVRAVQKGDVSGKKVSPQVRKMAKTIKPSSVKDFTKLKEIIDQIREDADAKYSLSKTKEIVGKPFDQVLRENVGVKFDKDELLAFQSKQNGFAGFGKTNFVHNRNTREITAEVQSNDSTKTYVFKKLENNQNKGLYNYACFIRIVSDDSDEQSDKVLYTLSNIFEDDSKDKIKVLTDFIVRINQYGL